jgi:hypothetical protein
MLWQLNAHWSDKTVQLYVDDGAIFASGTTIQSAIAKATSTLEEVTEWLAANGLRTDADKAEAMVFLPSQSCTDIVGHRPTHLAYRDPFLGKVNIKLSNQVRYLGLYIDHKLSWCPHVKIMAARARSTLQALSLLGNSVRGLRFAAWRRLFHAIIVPILTYVVLLLARAGVFEKMQ